MNHPLIFLDIDGVLNCHESDPEVLCGAIHRDKVQRLNRILRETGARIVLSSAWRYIIYRGEATLDGMDWLFRSHGMIARRLIGITRKDTMHRGEKFTGDVTDWPVPNERGEQIDDWLYENGESPYVVIDDMDLGISDRLHPFVLTNGAVGLTDADTEVAINLLREQLPTSDK